MRFFGDSKKDESKKHQIVVIIAPNWDDLKINKKKLKKFNDAVLTGKREKRRIIAGKKLSEERIKMEEQAQFDIGDIVELTGNHWARGCALQSWSKLGHPFLKTFLKLVFSSCDQWNGPMRAVSRAGVVFAHFYCKSWQKIAFSVDLFLSRNTSACVVHTNRFSTSSLAQKIAKV